MLNSVSSVLLHCTKSPFWTNNYNCNSYLTSHRPNLGWLHSMCVTLKSICLPIHLQTLLHREFGQKDCNSLTPCSKSRGADQIAEPWSHYSNWDTCVCAHIQFDCIPLGQRGATHLIRRMCTRDWVGDYHLSSIIHRI